MAMSAEDQLAVLDLLARYARCFDSRDVDGFVANFLPDGVIDMDGRLIRGREAIRADIGGLFAAGRAGDGSPRVLHFVALPYIEGDSECCTAFAYFTLFSQDASRTVATLAVGSYTDTIVKRDGRWLFETRVIAADLGKLGARRTS